MPGNPFVANANLLRVSIGRQEVVKLKMPNPIAQADLLGVDGPATSLLHN